MNGSDMQTYDTIRTNCFCDAGETARCRKGRKLETISRHIASLSKWGSLPVYWWTRRAPSRINHRIAIYSAPRGFRTWKMNKLTGFGKRGQHCTIPVVGKFSFGRTGRKGIKLWGMQAAYTGFCKPRGRRIRSVRLQERPCQKCKERMQRKNARQRLSISHHHYPILGQVPYSTAG